jgi:signal transduction histidine kinase/CheY-like chemotaxis protein
MAHTPRSRWRLHRTSAVILALTVAMTATGCLVTRGVMQRTEHRLLEQKAAEASLLLSSLMSQSYGAAGRGLGAALSPRGVDQATFGQIAGMLQAPSTGDQPGLGLSGVAIVDVARGRTLATSGTLLADLSSSVERTALNRAISSRGIVGAPADLGFVSLSERNGHQAMGMAVALGDGIAGYLEMPITAALQASDIGPGEPFAGLDFAVYVESATARHLVWSNKVGGRLSGDTATVHADLNMNATYSGASTGQTGPLVIELAAQQPLAGGFAMALPWLLLPLGLLTGLVVMALTETAHRRRDAAVALVAELQERNQEVETAVARQAEAEDRLRQAQRLEAVGQLAGGVAHDFNNLLAVMFSYLGFIRAAGAGQPWLADVDEVEGAARRAADLVKQLLMFSRRDPARQETLDLRELVTDRCRLLQRTLGDDIEVVVRVPKEPMLVSADPGELDQVIMNLAVNSRDAMTRGGRLVMLLDETQRDGVRMVRLSVGDTGTGMPPDVVEHAFEPFFTTKEVGRGTGLGLATVYGIVTRTGGSTSISSTPGQGTTVTVLLPRCSATETPDETAPADVDTPLEGTVLVVEDETAVRRATSRILEEAGYRVLQARSGVEALDVFRAQQVDIVVSDVVMPGGVTGPDLAQRLRQLRPGLPVVLCSGYGGEHLEKGGPLPADVQVLTKPYPASALVDAVQRGLSSAPGRRAFNPSVVR